MKHLSLRMKILSLLGFIFLVMLVVSLGFLWKDDLMEKNSNNAIQKSEFAKTIISKASDHIQWLNDLYNSILAGTSFSGALDSHECTFGEWYYSLKLEELDPELRQEIKSVSKALEESHELLHELARTLIKVYNTGNKAQEFALLNSKIPAAMVEFTGYLDHIIGVAELQSQKGITTYLKQKASMKKFLILFLIIALLTVIVLAIIITESIVRRINNVAKDLASGSTQITNASAQLSKASLSIAGGANKQATSVEETSAGLEEIFSIATQNTNNAKNASQFIENTKTLVDNANVNMMNMSSAIKEIVQSSQEIGKIIKTIDNIAFQTNLLALNAAVEAARAGEAGAGFAVVADEVRNLAQKSAESAKNTQSLISEIIRKIKSGDDIVESTKSAFTHVVEATNQIVQSIREITSSSEQQNKGIEDIQKAIVELDTVIQQSAATSQETSSAADEMNAQAEGLLQIVKDLNQVVFGKSSSIIQYDAERMLESPEQDREETGLLTDGEDHPS